jgi:hypothetical protein
MAVEFWIKAGGIPYSVFREYQRAKGSVLHKNAGPHRKTINTYSINGIGFFQDIIEGTAVWKMFRPNRGLVSLMARKGRCF